MRRALLTASILAVAATPAVAQAAGVARSAATFSSAAPLPASVKVTGCSTSASEAVFHARMRLLDGAHRMALRFTLLERAPAKEFRRLKAPGIEGWHWSKPGVRRFGHRKAFRNLLAGASYRVRVTYRWYAADGTPVGRTRRRSRVCHQFVRLPNLVAQLVKADPTDVPGVLRYEVRVTNSGRARATNVPLRLSVDGSAVNTRALKRLRAGETRVIGIRGPDCTTSAKVEADPDRLITETSDGDNAHELSCGSLRNPA